MASSNRRTRTVLTTEDWNSICTWRDKNRNVSNQKVVDLFAREENGALRFKIRTLQAHMVKWRELHGKLDSRRTKARAATLSRPLRDSDWMRVFDFMDAYPRYGIRRVWVHFKTRGFADFNVCEQTFRRMVQDRSRIVERVCELAARRLKEGIMRGIESVENRYEHHDCPATSQAPVATNPGDVSTLPPLESGTHRAADSSTSSLLVSQGIAFASSGPTESVYGDAGTLDRPDKYGPASEDPAATESAPATLKRNRSLFTENSDTVDPVPERDTGGEKRARFDSPFPSSTLPSDESPELGTSAALGDTPTPSSDAPSSSDSRGASPYDEAGSTCSFAPGCEPSSPGFESSLRAQLEQLGLRSRLWSAWHP